MAIPLPSSVPSAGLKKEPLMEKLVRKSKEQPLVPIGCILTVGALLLSARALKANDQRLANRMFYWRVGFQGFTLAALLGGTIYYGEQKKQEKSRDEKLHDLAKQREKLWIEELERIEAEAQERRNQAAELRAKLEKSK